MLFKTAIISQPLVNQTLLEIIPLTASNKFKVFYFTNPLKAEFQDLILNAGYIH